MTIHSKQFRMFYKSKERGQMVYTGEGHKRQCHHHQHKYQSIEKGTSFNYCILPCSRVYFGYINLIWEIIPCILPKKKKSRKKLSQIIYSPATNLKSYPFLYLLVFFIKYLMCIRTHTHTHERV